MAQYNNSSPWAKTPINQNYLDVFRIRPVSAESDDALYTIQTQYTYRPDLLAFDMYGTDKLWWVFTQRNMDVISDPIYDFVAGKTIYLPKKESLFKVLGL
jgi:alpha-L-fucosidase